MRTSRPIVITLLALSVLADVGWAADPASIWTIVNGNTAFALDLYAQLKTNEGNLFFSPYSISTCLGMTYAGASGDTSKQMSNVLHFRAKPEDLPEDFAGLQKRLNQRQNGIELSIANGLWAQADHPFRPAYLQTARRQFDAEVKQVDFRSQAESINQEINAWVSGKTKGKITGLLPPGLPDKDTRVLLVNAIYFKGQWEHPFEKRQTADADFSITPDKKVKTRLMHTEAKFKYAETADLQLLEMPYSNGNQSMAVLLPRNISGLNELELLLNPASLNNWLAQAGEQKVEVFLPKFKMTSQFGLADTLAQMGMTDAFTDRADFSGMDGARDLFISAVVHKAYVDVYEEGTEAAAATAVGMTALAMPVRRPTPVFRADHPFIFLIRDNLTGSILFLGRVADPTQ